MARPRKAEGIKFPLAFLFVLFLILNGLFGFLRPITTIYGTGDPVIVGLLDLPFGSRLLIFLVGVGVSWWIARSLYWFLFSRKVEVDDAINTAYMFFFYLLLTVTTFSFLGVLGWYWFPLLFLILFIVSLLTLWNFLGGLMTVGSFVIAAAVVVAIWFWSHTV